MLGKLRTRLSDDTFQAGLLLRSWHFAGLLPELGELAQCLRDSEDEKRKNEKAAQSSARMKRKRADIGPGEASPSKRLNHGTLDVDSE